jgi:helix-turn-helix protein
MDDNSRSRHASVPDDYAGFLAWVRQARDWRFILVQLRKAQHLTLEEVAALTGISPSQLSRLERGGRNAERETLICILLAGFSLPVPKANWVLIKAGFAPLRHTEVPPLGLSGIE